MNIPSQVVDAITSNWDLSWLEDHVPLENPVGRAIVVALGILLVAWLLGVVISMIVRAVGDRLHRNSTNGAILTIITSTIKAVIFVLGLLLASQVAGLNTQGLIASFGMKALSAIAILVGGWFIAGWLSGNVRSMGDTVSQRNNRVDRTLFSFSASLIKYVIVAVAIVVALTQFGFQTNSLVAVIGAAGLAIALALQDTLKGVAAGFMLASFRPYRLGDFIQVGDQSGTVVDITPFTTTLKTTTNATVILPNSQTWGNVITNYSTDARRRLDIYFSISYDDNMKQAMNVISDVCAGNDLILKDPAPWIAIQALANWSVDIRCRAWCRQADFLDARATLIHDVKAAFDAHGITIPYPHQVEIVQVPKPAAASGAEVRYDMLNEGEPDEDR